MDSTKCPKCGCSLSRVQRQFRLDCEYCYTWFHAELVNLFPRSQRPYQGTSALWLDVQQAQVKSIHSLQSALEKALEAEDYERAQELRNQLELQQGEHNES